MINKRLIGMVSESKKYVAAGVAFQWVSLVANILLTGAICRLLAALWAGTAAPADLFKLGALAAAALAVRFGCTLASASMSWRSSRAVKAKLRRLIYEKLLRLGTAGRQQVNTSEAVQVAVEGVDQLEIYFGQYLPQFFYAMLAPLTLFAVLAPVDLTSAVVLLVCVPLIPVSIAAVQTWAKKLLGRYWGQYTALGDTFLENLQGLTTLKIYGADAQKHAEMNEQAEQFRRITMKVLTMQLNSITIMDLIAYGGAAAGMALAVSRFAAGRVDLAGALFIILLAAEFFLPMRLLGSFFHVAMNGMAASDRIFALLDLPERKTFFRALVGWVGYRSIDVPFEVRDRSVGQSHFSTLSLIRYALSNLTAYSCAPMQIITALGGLFLVLAVVLGIQTLVRWASGTAADGFTTVILLLLLIGSILMIGLGIIGYYIAQIFLEIKARPRYLVAETCGAGGERHGS